MIEKSRQIDNQIDSVLRNHSFEVPEDFKIDEDEDYEEYKNSLMNQLDINKEIEKSYLGKDKPDISSLLEKDYEFEELEELGDTDATQNKKQSL